MGPWPSKNRDMALLHCKSRYVCKEKIQLLKKSTRDDISDAPYLTGAEVLNNRFLSENPEDFPNIVRMLKDCTATIADRVLWLASEVFNNRIPIDNTELIRACTIQIFNCWISDFSNWIEKSTDKGFEVGPYEVMTYLHETMKEKVGIALEFSVRNEKCFAFYRDIRTFVLMEFLLETFNFEYYDREQLELIEAEMEWLNKDIPAGPVDGINSRFLLECMKRGQQLLFAYELMTTPDANYEIFRLIQKDGVWFFKEFTAVSLSCDLWITDYNDTV